MKECRQQDNGNKACAQHNSGIGGQAVLEGVMMRNKDKYAIAVRRSDGSITIEKDTYKGILADSPLKKIPFVRGVFVFIDSMILGMRCTNYSAEIYAEDEVEESSEETLPGLRLRIWTGVRSRTSRKMKKRSPWERRS